MLCLNPVLLTTFYLKQAQLLSLLSRFISWSLNWLFQEWIQSLQELSWKSAQFLTIWPFQICKSVLRWIDLDGSYDLLLRKFFTVYGLRMSVCECKHHRHLPLWKIVQHPHWLWTNKPLSVSFDSVKAGLWKCRREVICEKTNVKHGLSESDECFAWQINCVKMMDSLHHHSHQVCF